MASKKFVDIKLVGDKRLQAAFQRLEYKTQGKILRRVITPIVRSLLTWTRDAAPIGPTGRLKRGLKARALPRSRKWFGRRVITPSRAELGIPDSKPGFYPMAVEAGTKGGKSPRHPNPHPAYPYMRKAFDDHRGWMNAELARGIWKAIKEEWNKP